MRKTCCIVVLIIIGACQSFAAYETVNGIEWTYRVSNGEASLGGGSSLSTAVPSSTKGALTIPSKLGGYPVAHIGSGAFFKCSGITSVAIPNSVIGIGDDAFYGCKSLTSVAIPNGVTSTGNYAFNDCTSLTSVTIPDSVTRIGDYAFSGCNGLKRVTIPNSVTSIGHYAFSSSGLTSVAIPNGVRSVGSHAFGGCRGLTSVTISDNVTSIGPYAFSGSGLTSVTIPDSVTSIENYVFSGCSRLTSVAIPDSVTSIGDYAFYNCSGLTSVTIPDSVTSIGNYVFSGCSRLTSVAIPDSVTSIGGCAFYNCSGLTSVAIPDGVISIGDKAFYGCRSLGGVTIPSSVVSIGTSTFSGCSGLTKVTIPQCVCSSKLSTVFSSAYQNITHVEILSDVRQIGPSAFAGCDALMSVMIPNGVTSIGAFAFSGCGRLANVTIPDSVISIGDNAFYECSSLDSVTIPNGVKCVGTSTFSGCGGLANVTIPDSVISIGDKAFYGCRSLGGVTIPSSVVSIGTSTFSGCSELASVAIPEGVTNIGDKAFYGCRSLGGVTIPSSVVSIGTSTFSGCSELASVAIPEGVTNIGDSAFEGCCGLTKVTIPNSVTNMGDSVFRYCSGLVAFNVSSQNQILSTESGLLLSKDGKNLIYGVNGEEIRIPDSVTSIDAYAFYGCNGITSVIIPNGVTNVGDSAFLGCDRLASIMLPWQLLSPGLVDGLLSHADWALLATNSDGMKEYRSAAIGHNASSTMTLTLVGACDFTFDWKVSSASGDDYLRWYLDGVEMARISGTGGTWQNVSVSVPTGDHIIKWTYSKNGNGTSGADCGWVRIPKLTELRKLAGIFPDSYPTLRCVTLTGQTAEIPTHAFDGCASLTAIDIPSSVTNIGIAAFAGCIGLTSVVIPDSVTSIGDSAFSDCGGLTSVAIPDSVMCIGESAFYNCSSLTNVTIGSGVTSIGTSAFYGCSGLTSVTIPDSVTSIGQNAFYNCNGLMSVTIPDSVTSIGSSAFSGCNGLKDVVIPQYVLDRQIRNVFSSSCPSITNVAYSSVITYIGSSAFSGCSELTSVTIPDSVTSIGYGAFYGCSGLTSITIPQVVCDMGLSTVFPAVYQTISSVHISDSVTNIADYAFAGCTNLQTEVWGGYRVLDGWLIGYTDEAEETIPDADKLKGICSEALKGCTALKRLEFGDRARLVSIGAEALKGCTELKTLVLPPSLTRIGDEAFMGCSYLDNVIVPGGVKSIGNRAFKNCTGFTWAQVEHGVESIGEEAFYGCWRITEVDIPSSVSSIGVDAFGGDSSITKIALRGDSRKVSEIFSTYAQITEATVKPGTGALVDGLFSGCWSLESVRFIGNCPALANDGQNLYENTPSGSWNGLVTYIDKDSTGWDGTPGSHSLPMKWPLYGSYRREIRYAENISTPYAVEFDANGGTPKTQSEEQISESLFVLPNEPTRAGYVFMGWWTEKNGGVKITEETVFIEGVYSHLYAHWLKPYRVYLDPDGGSVSEDYVSYADQAVYGNLPEPLRTGYAFVGWDIAGEIISPETPIATATDHTLVAMWEANHYSIVFSANGGTGTMDDQYLVYDVAAPLLGNEFTLSGCLFRGWATTADGAVVYRDGAFVENLSATDGDVVTLYAVWQEKPASVLACEDAFGGAGTVSLDENDNIVVTLTNDVSGTVEIPDYVGVVTIDLNGHDMVGDGGLGETALPGGPAIRIVKGDGESGGGVAATQLAIVDTSEGEKGQISGGGESAGIEVAEDAAPSVRFDVEEGVGVFNGDGSEQPWWELCPVEATLVAGKYFKATLAELGYDVPTNGTPYSVVAKGLPAGLKLKYNAAVTKKVKKGKTTKKVVVKPAKVEWWIEGVPTAAVDFFTNPPYLVIAANGKTVTEPLPIEVLAQNVTDLGELALGETVNEQYYLPGVTSRWAVSGLPTGLKYTAKLLTTSKKVGKKTVVTTNALPYSVYGKTTKAGLFTITAKRKVGAFYETMKYRVLVRPKAVDTALFGEELANITTMAYVPFEWDLTNDVAAVGGKVAKVAGLPAGLTFAAKDTYAYANAKKKTGKYLKQYGQTIVGTPTKPGTYVVTFTKNVTTGTGKNKKTVAKTAQILWTVTASDANLELGFNTAGGVIEGGTVGLKYGDLMAFSATDGAAVTASGLPSGITLANLGDGSYAFRGFTTKAGTYLVTVKATLKGKTVAQRVALKVDGLPSWAKGTFNGYIAGVDGATNGLATITVSSVGKISGKFQEGGTNWTFTAASYTGYDNAAPAYSVPVVAKYAYKATEIVKGKKKTVTKSVARNFTLRVGQDALGGMAMLEEVDGSTVHAWQNLWGSTYKALGARLFYTSKKKPYRVFTINGTSDIGMAMGLLPAETLSLKVTPTGAVTATMSFDTGKKSKGKAVIYKATCSTTVIPLSAADAEEFEGEAILFFAPSTANGFPGFAGAAPF